MNVLGLEIKERKLKREEVLLLTADVLACEGVIKETRGDKNGKLILTRRELITVLFASGIRMISLYGVLDKTVAEQVILKEEYIIADMKAAGVDMDEILKFCEPEDESYNKEEEYGDDNQH